MPLRSGSRKRRSLRGFPVTSRFSGGTPKKVALARPKTRQHETTKWQNGGGSPLGMKLRFGPSPCHRFTMVLRRGEAAERKSPWV